MTNPDNTGLEGPIRDLQVIVDKFEGDNLTRTDIWMLSGLVATEIALPGNADTDMLDLGLQWRGRKTCEDVERIEGHCGVDFNGNKTICSPFGGPHRELCHGSSGTANIQQFFQDQFGSIFDDKQITTLMGAHSVGRMRRNNTGLEGQWDLTPNKLDSGYFRELANKTAPDYKLVLMNNSDIDSINNTMQWEGSVYQQSMKIVMMNADVALVRNLPDVDDVDCTFTECDATTPFREHVELYATDQDQFLLDFRDVLNLLIDHGHEDVKYNCSHDEICLFPDVTHYPSSAPSVAPSGMPTTSPSSAPSTYPSDAPSQTPTTSPSYSPTNIPSASPTVSPRPSFRPSGTPSSKPTDSPTSSPTTGRPTVTPTSATTTTNNNNDTN
jgi:Peroxidase